MNRGVAVISIDTELVWGEAHRRDGATVAPGHDYGAERGVIERMLRIFERHRIGATWAVVGHLFLDRCERVDGRAHPEIVRPRFDWLDGDWFDVDPCSVAAEAPTYYGPDIVERIRACPVPQEIGCHSFAHVMAGDPGCGVEAFRTDLAACVAAAESRHVTLRSFVFPRNSIGHVGELAVAGFTNYRGRPSTGPTRPTRDDDGIWDIPQTYLFAPATHLAWLPMAMWARLPIRRLRQAVRQRSLFHLWFHPYNITADVERGLDGLERVCAEAARLRDRGRLDVVTMGELAERLELSRR